MSSGWETWNVRLGRAAQDAVGSLAGAVGLGGFTWVVLDFFVEAIDHRGLRGGQLALAIYPYVKPAAFGAIAVGVVAVWLIARRLYRGAPIWARAVAVISALVVLIINALGWAWAVLAYIVCTSSGTGCVKPTEAVTMFVAGMVGAGVVGVWWMRISRPRFHVGKLGPAG